MKVCRFAVLALAALMLSGACGAATEFKNGTAFALGNVPKELVVERRAGEMGAKFSFGTNNFDPGPKDLSKWLEAIVWLDLGPSDIWTPAAR